MHAVEGPEGFRQGHRVALMESEVLRRERCAGGEGGFQPPFLQPLVGQFLSSAQRLRGGDEGMGKVDADDLRATA